MSNKLSSTQINIEDGNSLTGAEAGINRDEQIRIALQVIVDNGGIAQMRDITDALRKQVELRKPGYTLSSQGDASLRANVNHVAVKAGYIFPYDKDNPGWRITPEGREFLGAPVEQPLEVVNTNTQSTDYEEVSISAWSAFESDVLRLLKEMYPKHAWYHQGRHKNNERGLDMIGTPLAEQNDTIGVQVKYHKDQNQPTDTEWLKFLAGCFARRVEKALFVTTGRLSSNQRREASEAGVIVIEGRDEVKRIAKQFKLEDILQYEESGS